MPDTRLQQRRPVHAGRFKPCADRSLRKVFAQIGVPEPQAFVSDPFQVEAVAQVAAGDVLVSAPTGSGKTWIAIEAMRTLLAAGKRCWYASPLKALSNSKLVEFSEIFGAGAVGIITGDRKENTDAPVVVGTTEILRNQLYDAMNHAADFRADLVVLDEAHYLGDSDRGVVWEEVLIYLPRRVRLLMLSASVPNAGEIAGWLAQHRGQSCSVVESTERSVPLHPLYLLPSGDLLPLAGADGISHRIEQHLHDMRKYRFRRHQRLIDYNQILRVLCDFDLLPAVFFLKSRTECNTALHACQRWMVSDERQQRLSVRLAQLLREYPFLAAHPQLRNAQFHGLGSHHGGQLPHWKLCVEKLMQEGLLDAIFSTSTVAAGVNFPARSVVLVQSDRFNGREFMPLSATELHQATGRAGRRGKDRVGFAVFVHGPFQNPHLIHELFHTQPEPIASQITINFSMCLNLLLGQTPAEIRQLLGASFATYQSMDALGELRRRSMHLAGRADSLLAGSCCDSAPQALALIDRRRDGLKRLHRLERKHKKLVKGCARVGDDPAGDERVARAALKIREVAGRLDALPCQHCPNTQLCRNDQGFISTLRDAAAATQAFDAARDRLWNEFQRHIDFLAAQGFARSDGSLTPDGMWASQLRLEHPLIIAELIRRDFLASLTPELLAGIVAVFVTDKQREIDIDPQARGALSEMRRAYRTMQDACAEMLGAHERDGFPVPQMQFWPAAALHAWAGGRAWEELLGMVSVDEGDLAMMIFRTADNLRQLVSLEQTHPALAGCARAAVGRLLREPVVPPL